MFSLDSISSYFRYEKQSDLKRMGLGKGRRHDITTLRVKIYVSHSGLLEPHGPGTESPGVRSAFVSGL